MDKHHHQHHHIDDVIRNYYGSVHRGRKRGIHDMEKVIHRYYAPSDRRLAVLKNYYGGGGDVIAGHFKRLHNVLGNYYGRMDLYRTDIPVSPVAAAAQPAASSAVPANVVLSKSFDDGEVLQQGGDDEEYIVAKAMEEENFEEYVVYGQSVGEEDGEEYVVYAESLSDEDDQPKKDSGPVDLDAYDKQVLKELNINIDDPLAGAKSYFSSRSMDAAAAPVAGAPAPAKASAPAPEKDSDDDSFLSDLQSILDQASGKKQPDAPAPPSVAQSLPRASEHAIFDKIAQSMQYANAYDLGTVELENRFENFDQYFDRQEAGAPALKGNSAAPAPPANGDTSAAAKSMTAESDVIPNPADFIKDLDSILKGDAGGNQQQQQQPYGNSYDSFGGGDTFMSMSAPEPGNTNWPPRPTNIRQYTSAERIAKFGEFKYIADPSTYGGDGIKVLNDWDKTNIIMVDIPQLSKLKISKMAFHRDGASMLQDLWKAWEDAGLLDRVLTFDGSYATRYIRHTEERNPRPLSNHAWGTAFDINASLNAFGSEPALVGEKGCVRELVEIANQHGFYWGGHFGGHKDGMHFELGKIIS